MNVVIDSYGLLSAIGRHRDAFAGIDALVKKQATALLTAQLKHKSFDLNAFRAIVSAIGIEPFELFLDTVDEKLLRGVAKKLDQYASITKSGDDDALRDHLIDLAAKRIEPTIKPGKSPIASKKAAPKSSASETSDSTAPHAIATKPPGRR
jgi:hypothetical protein